MNYKKVGKTWSYTIYCVCTEVRTTYCIKLLTNIGRGIIIMHGKTINFGFCNDY